MLTALHVGNFKAFADTQRIPIRPLTFIYGANSAGKSSIIHSLILARHALETGELDVHRTSVGGESVDLGGFHQYVHRHEASRRVEWAIDLDTSAFTGRLADIFAPVQQVTMLLQIGIELDNMDQPKPGALPELHTYELQADGQSLLRMSRRRDDRLQLDRLDHDHAVFRQITKAVVLSSTTTETLHPGDFEGLDEAISDLVPEIIAESSRFLPEGLVKSEATSPRGQATLFPISKGRRREDLAAAVAFFLPRTIDEMLKAIGQAAGRELSRLQYLGPLRSYPPRHLAFAQYHDPNWHAGGGYAWDVVRRDAQVRSLINEWLGSPDRLQTPYELVIRELVGLDQLERPVWESLESLESDGLTIKPDYDDKPEPEKAYPAIEDFDQEVTRMVEAIREADMEKLSELNLVDRRSNTIVSHRDVGIGITQVLPVLVGAYASSDRLLAMEQPEIHLHPALQADLGDVFIQSAFGRGKNTLFIETHSEHLLLRVMKRMRQTVDKSLPDGIPPVRPEGVTVLYVEPDGARSIVREMPLNERGELVKAWPGGFFEEGLREVF